MYTSVNFLAVLIAAIVAFFIGYMWHGPLFGKQWMKLSNISQKDIDAAHTKDMIPAMVTAFFQQLVTAYVLAMFAGVLGVSSAVEAITLAFWAWLGFIVTAKLNAVLWEKQPINLYLFNITHHLVSLVPITLIVGLWR